jgi:hypothetical protein
VSEVYAYRVVPSAYYSQEFLKPAELVERKEETVEEPRMRSSASWRESSKDRASPYAGDAPEMGPALCEGTNQ